MEKSIWQEKNGFKIMHDANDTLMSTLENMFSLINDPNIFYWNMIILFNFTIKYFQRQFGKQCFVKKCQSWYMKLLTYFFTQSNS